MTLLIVVAFVGAATSSYPDAAVTSAFQNVCLSHASEAEMIAAASAAGWKQYKPRSGSPFVRMVNIQKDWARESGVSSRISTFAREVNGVTLSLLIDRTAPFKQWASRVDCGVFDFEAKRRLSDAAVSKLRSEPPGKFHTSDQIWFREWEAVGGTSSMRVGFVPATSPFVKQIGLVGTSLQASYNLETK